MATAPIAAGAAAVDLVDAAVELNNLGSALFMRGKYTRASQVFEASFQCAFSESTPTTTPTPTRTPNGVVVPPLATPVRQTQAQPQLRPQPAQTQQPGYELQPQPRPQLQEPQIDPGAVTLALAAARSWVAEDAGAQATTSKNPQILQQHEQGKQQRYVPPPSVFSLPVRLDKAAVLRNSNASARRNGNAATGIFAVGGQSGANSGPFLRPAPSTKLKCSESEIAAIAFNLALTHHLLGRSLLSNTSAVDPGAAFAHFHVALTFYQHANVTASRRGYKGGLCHVAKSLLCNMADIHRNILGDDDYAEELLEEMDAVHELTGMVGVDRGGGTDRCGWGSDVCPLDIWSADLPPGAAPSA